MAAEADTIVAPPPPESKVGPASSSDVSARLQQVLALLFPSNLAAKAALFALVVALLPLLPSSQAAAPRIWELPHLLLLGIIISYGVFGQKNADAEVVAAAKPADGDAPPSVEAYVSEMMQGSLIPCFEQNDDDRDDGDNGGGVQAWSSQYVPDDPLVVVAEEEGKGAASEKPLHLPVSKLKPEAEESFSDGIEDEEAELRSFVAPKGKSGYDIVRERAIPSPNSVLDADLTLSPSSPPLLPPPPPPPPPPPFLCTRRRLRKPKSRSFNEFGLGDRSTSGRLDNKQQFRSKSAVHATRSAITSPSASIGYEEVDDEDEFDDEMVAGASESSFSGEDMLLTDNDKEEDSYEEEDDDDGGGSCDEELFELATRPGPEADETEDEVDRKAEEFIAKFRGQIRMQRAEPARR